MKTGWIGAASGILSPIAVVVGFAIHGPFPAEGDSVHKIAHYYSAHAGSARIWAGGYVEFLGYLLFLPFAMQVRLLKEKLGIVWTMLKSFSTLS